MSDAADRLATACPACSPQLEVVHEVLTEGAGSLTIRCGDCGHVHKVQPEPERTVPLDVVVSQGGESFSATVETPADETIAAGEEFLIETEELLATVRVTDVEVGPERRVEEAVASEVETVWTREVENVEVPVTIHPSDGRRDETRSRTLLVPGAYEFAVGERESLEGVEFTVEALLVREDATGYDRERYEHDGDVVLAKDLKRVYAFDERSGRPWSGW